MRQTRPFIVEIRQSRKSKSLTHKTSIWGDVDLSQDRDLPKRRQQRGLRALRNAGVCRQRREYRPASCLQRLRLRQ